MSSDQSLFLDTDFRTQVEKAVASSTQSVDVLVGFAKLIGMQWLADLVEERDLHVSVIVGWTMQDLAAGSSDLEAFEFARSRNWKFGIRPELHAKLFWCDKDELLIGSANLTNRGLHLAGAGNIEAGARITPSNIDKTKLEDLIAKSVWLDDQCYADICTALENEITKGEDFVSKLYWPDSIQVALSQMKDYLWVDDMLMTHPVSVPSEIPKQDYEALLEHDRRLLAGHSSQDSQEDLVLALRQTSVFKWLVTLIQEQEDKSANFGKITKALHDALLDDPKPYRRDVKSLLANLFAWIEYVDMPEFEIRKHTRTSSIHLVEIPSPDGFGI